MGEISLGTGITAFAGAFGMWAWVVAWGVSVMRKEMSELKDSLMAVSAAQNIHITQTERRLTMLEAEFGYIKASIMRFSPPHHEARHEP